MANIPSQSLAQLQFEDPLDNYQTLTAVEHEGRGVAEKIWCVGEGGHSKLLPLSILKASIIVQASAQKCSNPGHLIQRAMLYHHWFWHYSMISSYECYLKPSTLSPGQMIATCLLVCADLNETQFVSYDN